MQFPKAKPVLPRILNGSGTEYKRLRRYLKLITAGANNRICLSVFKHLLKRIMSERAGQLQSSGAGLSVVLLVDMSAFAYMRHKGIACPAAGNLCRLLWCEYRM